MKPKLVVFASGTPSTTLRAGAGGSGFENLVHASHDGRLDADIVAVVSNHEHGGVRDRAERLNISFIHFKPRTSDVLGYRGVVEQVGAQWAALSGWLHKVEGLDPAKTFNIHPALLSQLGGRFGGHGMWGHHVHEAVKAAFDAGEITHTGLSMHFVTDEFDRGPIFFEHRVPITAGMTVDDIAAAVHKAEHEWQPIITNKVVQGHIHWDGSNPDSLVGAQLY